MTAIFAFLQMGKKLTSTIEMTACLLICVTNDVFWSLRDSKLAFAFLAYND